MPKTQQWSINLGNIPYEITFISNQWSGKHKLTVNGKEVDIQRKPFQAFTGIDQPITIGTKEARFVLIGNKADIAVDGKYLESEKTYVPLKSVTWWAWLFVILCAAIPVVALGGVVPIVLAIAGAALVLRVSILPDLKTGIKFLACLGIPVADWAIFAAFVSVISLLQ